MTRRLAPTPAATSVLVRYQVQVPGTEVPGAEFKAEAALVKAAKTAIRDTTAEAQSALQRANDELAEIRHHEARG